MFNWFIEKCVWICDCCSRAPVEPLWQTEHPHPWNAVIFKLFEKLEMFVKKAKLLGGCHRLNKIVQMRNSWELPSALRLCWAQAGSEIPVLYPKCPARENPNVLSQQQHWNSASLWTLQKPDPTRMLNKCFRLSLALSKHMGVIYWHEYLEAVLIMTSILVHCFQNPWDLQNMEFWESKPQLITI